MNPLRTLLLVAMFVTSNGCISSRVVDLARGHTHERIHASDIKKGDRLVDGDRGAMYVIQHPQGKDNSHLDLPTIPPYHGTLYVAHPHPAYYALLSLSVPADIVTFPIQAIVIGAAVFGGVAGGH